MTNQTQQSDTTELAYSRNGEDWHDGPLDEFIADNDLNAGDVIYIGDKAPPKHSQFFNASDILEFVGERAYDEFSEFAEDFPNASIPATEELQEFLEAWAEKHIHITFYNIVNDRQYVITDDDIAEAYIHAE